jgi:hypothetical protein
MTLTPAESIRDPEVAAIVADAAAFLWTHDWCGAILDLRVAFAVAGVLAVVRADLEPRNARADARVWLIAGDLPPAYIAWEDADTWKDALRGYVFEIRRWIDAVRAHSPVADLIPVNVAPTEEYAELLSSRLAFIERELLSQSADAVEGDH